ncbi:MAG: efflux RND transporter permease subunit [Bacteroidaceae bacterium]|nr:efflux RND transporter permease subunit [Bacteroidaceae bacterium]
MLNKIIRFSLNNRLLVLVLSVLLMVAGVYTATTMDVDVFPDLNAPTVTVMTEAKGMAPEEVERLVTFPIETAVNGATDVRRVRSSSTTGFSIVWVEFDWGTDIYRARQIVSEKIATVMDALPQHVGTPTLGPQSSILGEVLFVGLTVDDELKIENGKLKINSTGTHEEHESHPDGNNSQFSIVNSQLEKTSLQDLRTLADWTIRPRLLATGGVAQVAVLGGEVKEYQILLSPEKMMHYDVSLGEVMEVVSGMNQNATGGTLYEYGNEYIIRGMLSTNDVDEIGRTVVKRVGGAPLLLNHIAEVKIGDQRPKFGMASLRTEPAVILTVTKQPNTSTLELTKKLDATLEDIKRELPADVKVTTDVYRQERFINSSIDNVKSALIEGAIFVVIVLFIFLMNVRTTLISLVTIPLAFVAAILTLNAFGLTINTMSLGGLAIAIGSLVDDAIVDVENVYKRLRENRALPIEQRRPVLTVIYDASREVRMPILNSTLIIIASFVPLFFLTGMEGRMLAPLGIAFIVALCASTLVALTLTPVLCSYLLSSSRGEKDELKINSTETHEEYENQPDVHNSQLSILKRSSLAEGKSNSQLEKEPPVTRWLKKGYTRLLSWTLRHRWPVLGSTAALLVVALVAFFGLGRSFLPPFNEGSFTINVATLPGISLEESDKIGRRAEELLLTIPEIQTVGRKTGRAELDEHALGVNVSEIEAPFELADRSKDELIAEVREKLGTLPGVNVEVGAPISHRIDAMLSGTRASIAVKIFGTDLNEMYRIGNRVKAAVEGVEGIADLNVEQQVERPQLKIVPKRDVMAKYGVTMPEFADMVSVLLAGEPVSQVYEGRRVFNLTLKVGDDSRATAEDIRRLIVDAGDAKVPLGQIADVVSSVGPNTINRENVERKVVVSANVAGRDLRGVVTDMRRIIEEQIELPEDYHIQYGGQFENEENASRTILIASLFAIMVIFMLLYNQFRSLVQSAVILVNLPLALIGGVLMLWFTGGELSIPALIGFISLFGIATRNGMLLIERYNDLRAEGYSVVESVLRGSADRLNPILMTALTTALALIPLAIGGDLPGNEIQSPMAKVILGGLATSTLLNGFIVPIMYMLVAKKETK